MAPDSKVVAALAAVIEHEAPIHVDDVVARVAGFWNKKAGSRIAGRIQFHLQQNDHGRWLRRGEFIWDRSGTLDVRNRQNTRIPAERICPEEYRKAAILVLEAAGVLSRSELTVEVRSVLGFNRTGPALEKAINDAVDSLLSQGRVGEGSAGIALRS